MPPLLQPCRLLTNQKVLRIITLLNNNFPTFAATITIYDTMLKLLLQLWAVQQRRNFNWGRFLGEAYFFLVFLAVSIIATLAAYENTDSTAGMERVAVIMAACIIVPDFINKLLIKHDETVMDHYLKSKPVDERAWCRFLLVTNVFNFWNWSIPVLLLPFCILFLPAWAIAPAFVLFVAVSMVGGVAITAFRRAKGWTNKWPVLVAMLMWQLFAFVWALVGAFLPWWLHAGAFVALCGGAVTVFYHYLCGLRRYDESQARGGHVLLGGRSSLFSMEYVSVLRSKRLRAGCLVGLVFVFNAYTQTINGLNVIFYSMLMFAVFFPSMMLGQWVFGVEANYFDGLWTKPVNIRLILRNKFWFYALLDVPTTLLCLPLVWTAGLSPWLLAATWLFAVGVANLSLMPTCLISSRIELFQSAFFNYQGASLAINLYGLIVLIPVAVYCLCTWLLTPLMAAAVLAVSGLVGIALHTLVLDRLALNYERRRYTCFERYRN